MILPRALISSGVTADAVEAPSTQSSARAAERVTTRRVRWSPVMVSFLPADLNAASSPGVGEDPLCLKACIGGFMDQPMFLDLSYERA